MSGKQQTVKAKKGASKPKVMKKKVNTKSQKNIIHN